MAQRQGQGAVAAHGMAADRPRARGRELGVYQGDQFVRDIGLHAEVRSPGRLGRIDIEARALAQVIGRIIGHTLAARRGVGRDDDDAVFSGGAIGAGLGGEIVLGAGQARQPDQHRERPLPARREDRQGHRCAGHGAVVLQIAQGSAVDDVGLGGLHQSTTRCMAQILLPEGSRR